MENSEESMSEHIVNLAFNRGKNVTEDYSLYSFVYRKHQLNGRIQSSCF